MLKKYIEFLIKIKTSAPDPGGDTAKMIYSAGVKKGIGYALKYLPKFMGAAPIMDARRIKELDLHFANCKCAMISDLIPIGCSINPHIECTPQQRSPDCPVRTVNEIIAEQESETE